MSSKVRNSNIELLRIIAIAGIVCHHILVHSLGLYNYDRTIMPESSRIIMLFLNAATENLLVSFVIISGYFSIKLRIQSILHFYFTCVCYILLVYIIQLIFFDKPINFIEIFLPFSHSGNLWFLLSYFVIMLLSPLINKFIAISNNQQKIVMLGLLLFVVMYFDMIYHKTIINAFVLFYYIGAMIRHFDIKSKLSFKQSLFAWIAAIFALFAAAALAYLILWDTHPAAYVYMYNLYCPLSIIAATAAVVFFLHLKIQSKIINYIASSAFAVYIIHENKNSTLILYSYLHSNFAEYGFGLQLLLECIALIVILFALAAVFELIRRIVFEPLQKFILKRLPDKITNFKFDQ